MTRFDAGAARSIAWAAAFSFLLVTVSPVWAADLSEVHVNAPAGLIRGIVFSSLAGSWYQTSTVADDELHAELTLQLPTVDSDAIPGPVVVLWQLRVIVADAQFGDVSERLVGPPQVTALLPNCDAVGNCAVRLRVSGSVESATEAADLEWVSRAALGLSATVVRTFDEGSLWQAVKPDLPADADGGVLSTPSDMFGALNLSNLFAPDVASPGEIPGIEFHVTPDELYDWGAAVRAALADFEAPASPEPVPINVWIPERPDVLRVQLRIQFSDRCPDDRFIVLSDDRTHKSAASLFVGGRDSAIADFALPLSGTWSIALQAGTGEVLNATSLQPLGTGTGIQVSGPLRCSNGKGVFNQEGIPQIIPNPSGAGSPRPDTTADGGSVALAVPVVAVLAIAAIGVVTFLRLRRPA